MKHKLLIAALLPLFGFGAPALADELADATQAACDKTKACIMQSMGNEEELPPEIRAMIVAQLDSACIGIQQSYGAASENHPLAASAAACMRSIAALDCDELNNGDTETPECQAYQDKADSYEQ